MGSRPPDRSLPLQEPEEDNRHEDEPEYTHRDPHSSPTPSSDLYPDGYTTCYDIHHERRDDDDETLNEESEEQQNKGGEDSESGSRFMLRSPSTTLLERIPVTYGPQTSQYAENQKTIRAAKHRSRTTDQLGMRSFDLTMFERDTLNSLRITGTQDARTVARRVKPPPRVDSTQPRDTSPEPSSGEKTAGEERFVDQYEQEMDRIINGKRGDWNSEEIEASPPGEDDGERVDEEEDGEEEDLLDLEFQPSYVSNPQRRRRRFYTRWDAVVQAVSAFFIERPRSHLILTMFG